MRPLSILIMNRQYDRTIGGVERMSVALANQMAAYGHDCHIISLDLQDATMYFELDPKVHWHKISITGASQKAGWKERFARLFKIRSIIKKHKIDVAIGFQDGAYLSVMTAAFGTGVPVVAAERNAPSRFDFLKNKNLKKIVFNSFRLADRITVQCPSYVVEYPTYLRHKITVIANPVPLASVLANPQGVASERKHMLFVGRFGFQKNLETLIKAFALTCDANPAWDLKLVGDGDDKAKMAALAQSLNISGRVIFAGATKDVNSHYAKAQAFCLPSLWEGFPNALAEAMAHGLPSVGYAFCSGVKDLITDGRTGFLAKGDMRDPAPLADRLDALMKDDDMRVRMGAAAYGASKAYEPEIIFQEWDALFKSLARHP